MRRNTYGESACWYASQTAKLTVPLAYNFITFLPEPILRRTTFYGFLGRLIVLTPIGKGFDTFFPIFILVPVCATLFNLYGRVKQVFGFDVLDEGEDDNPTGYGTGGWREGRDLIERELASSGSSNGFGQVSLPVAAASPSSRASQFSTISSSPSNPRVSTPSVPPDPSRTRTSQRRAREALAGNSRRDDPEGDEEGNFFSDFAHRVKNTLDTTDTPSWMQKSFKRPKWMAGPAPEGTSSSSGGERGGNERGGLTTWFRRKASDGNIRL